MSGEAYLYKLRKLVDLEDEDVLKMRRDLAQFMYDIGRELSYGVSLDACLKCAERRAIAALHEWLRDDGNTQAASALTRDVRNFNLLCDKHQEEVTEHRKKMGNTRHATNCFNCSIP